MASQYVVAAACVVAKVNSDTGEGYFYKGAVLPDGVPQTEKDRLVEAGLVKEEAATNEQPDLGTDRPAPSANGQEVDVDQLKLADARDLAASHGLPTDGTLADLKGRIKAHRAANGL